MIRQFLHAFVNLLFKLLARVEIVGLENLPAQGGCIVACNHMSRIDPVLVFAVGKRRDMTALVADKYKRNLFIHPLIVAVGGIWINREEADVHALREARQFLKDGGMLGIAPEGTRKHTPYWKSGFYYMALGAQVPIVLAFIDYRLKHIGFGPSLFPSGDIQADFAQMRAFYADKEGLYPENHSTVMLKPVENGIST